LELFCLVMSESEKLEPFPGRNRLAARSFKMARCTGPESKVRPALKVRRVGLG
jgi:hypothetical protein